jgi:hypothetical protein
MVKKKIGQPGIDILVDILVQWDRPHSSMAKNAVLNHRACGFKSHECKIFAIFPPLGPFFYLPSCWAWKSQPNSCKFEFLWFLWCDGMYST